MIEKIYNEKIKSILDLVKWIEGLKPNAKEKEGSVPTLRRVETELQDLYVGIEWVRRKDEDSKKEKK